LPRLVSTGSARCPSCELTGAVTNLGSRSLPQSLGGGDLDGDLYNIIQYERLFPKETVEPAPYESAVLKQLPEGQRCTIDDVADFVVDFINNDRLGIISQSVGIPGCIPPDPIHLPNLY